MSIYRREGSPYYWTEFQIDGVRFRISTGESDKRLAQSAEKRLKAGKKAELETERAKRTSFDGKPAPTMGYVAARYWDEVGRFHSTPKTTWNSIEWLVDHFGESTLLTEIDGSRIAMMVARRRGIRIHRDKASKRIIETNCDTTKNATVNRYATEPLRKLFRRARDVWGYAVPYPQWGEFLLPEPMERVREASLDEESAIIEALGEDYGRLFRFMIATGMRSQAALLTWRQVDLINTTARVLNKGKDGQERFYTIPLSRAAAAILDECKGHNEVHVFTYAARRDIPKKTEKGKRYPITNNGFKSEWRRRIRDADIAPDFRRHDTRHTTGTRFLRSTGNLKATQKLLGHSRIETTLRYAHVLVDDIRNGLEKMEASVSAKPEIRRNGRKERIAK